MADGKALTVYRFGVSFFKEYLEIRHRIFLVPVYVRIPYDKLLGVTCLYRKKVNFNDYSAKFLIHYIDEEGNKANVSYLLTARTGNDFDKGCLTFQQLINRLVSGEKITEIDLTHYKH